jgi:O-antigen/teichoic acid export membrane protein
VSDGVARLWGSELIVAGHAVASRGLTVLLGVASSIAFARGLGAEGRGRFAIAAAVLGIGVQAVTLGMHASLPYYVAKAPGTARKLLAAGTRWMLLASLLFGIAVAGWALAAELDWYRDCGTALTTISLFAVPVGAFQLLSQATLLGLGKTTLYCWVEPVARLATVVAVVALIWSGLLTPEAALISSAAMALGAGLWAYCSITRGEGPIPGVREQLHYMWKSAVIALLATMPSRMLTLTLPSRAPLDEVGLWGVALTVVETMNSIAGSVVAVRLAPLLAESRDGRSFWRKAWIGVAGVFVVTVFMCASAAMAMPVVVRAAFGHDFEPASDIVIGCLPGVIAYSTSAMLQAVLAARGQPKSALLAPTASVGATVVAMSLPMFQCGIWFAYAYSGQAAVALIVSAAVTVRMYRIGSDGARNQ